MLAKYLHISGVEIEGYLIGQDDYEKVIRGESKYKVDKERKLAGFQLFSLQQVFEKKVCMENIGILLAGSNIYIDENIKSILSTGFVAEQMFIVSEFNKSTISHKMTPKEREHFGVEVNVVDHCNLNCQMCDHFSPLASPWFLDLDSFESGCKRLSELFGGTMGYIALLGGEPLLHKELPTIIRIARKYFPNTHLGIYTNGLLLKHWEKNEAENLWEVCNENNVGINITVYPIAIDIEEITSLSKQYHVKCSVFSDVGNKEYKGIKMSVHNPFDLNGNVKKYEFICCYQFNECFVLREGKIYLCAPSAYHTIFNNYFKQSLPESPMDYIDIYKAKSWQEITEFSARRSPFCDYCKIFDRKKQPWAQSKKNISEYT